MRLWYGSQNQTRARRGGYQADARVDARTRAMSGGDPHHRVAHRANRQFNRQNLRVREPADARPFRPHQQVAGAPAMVRRGPGKRHAEAPVRRRRQRERQVPTVDAQARRVAHPRDAPRRVERRRRPVTGPAVSGRRDGVSHGNRRDAADLRRREGRGRRRGSAPGVRRERRRDGQAGRQLPDAGGVPRPRGDRTSDLGFETRAGDGWRAGGAAQVADRRRRDAFDGGREERTRRVRHHAAGDDAREHHPLPPYDDGGDPRRVTAMQLACRRARWTPRRSWPAARLGSAAARGR